VCERKRASRNRNSPAKGLAFHELAAGMSISRARRTSVPRLTSSYALLHKEQALSCHCPHLSAGGECLRERSVLRGVAVNQLDSTPRQHQRHFTRGRVISAAYLFAQASYGKRRSGDRSSRTPSQFPARSSQLNFQLNSQFSTPNSQLTIPHPQAKTPPRDHAEFEASISGAQLPAPAGE
jgi:hypothetical protein